MGTGGLRDKGLQGLNGVDHTVDAVHDDESRAPLAQDGSDA